MESHKNKTKNLNDINAKEPYQTGRNPEMDAWYTAFFIENHLDYYTYPDHAASPEQVRFMVYTEEDERYYPCSDRMFEAIMNRNQSDFLQKKYSAVLQRILTLIDEQIEDKRDKKYLKSLIKIKYEHETRDEIMIPSRLEKRLFKIFLNRTQIEDPYMSEKNLRNRRVGQILKSEAFNKAINYMAGSDLAGPPTTLTEIKELLENLELKRLLSLSIESSLWESDQAVSFTMDDYLQLFNRQITGNGVEPLLRFLGILGKDKSPKAAQKKKILWVANESGEFMVDLAIIRYLAKQGHKIIIAFKEGPLFTKINFNDPQKDEILNMELEGVLWITERNLGKNELAKTFRSDTNIIAISDGTQENLNLLLTSTTFARVFKEVDCIISKGHELKRRFFETHFQFVQDIYNISENDQGSVLISYKPKHPSVQKFSHEDLEKKARKIIEHMQGAKNKGMTVIFYSAIIGSIPGKIKMANKILSVFIDNLKKQSAETLIINPSEHYEPGMDADDLMYMWEIVQKSGLIDIWRFQTYDDIVEAFQIMGKKIPPEWVGKDATFSTGCTKEMRTAIEVQQKHPEMQIIGPSREKFMRRNEYGVGKMYDQRLSEIIHLR